MAKYSLVGIDGNAFYIIGYVIRALKREGLSKLCSNYKNEATSGDYENLLVVSMKYLDKANEKYESEE